MSTAVCTLFEKDYHHGVAALANSLIKSGFEGKIYAGFRGPLPAWASTARTAALGPWSDVRALPVTDGCELVFVPLPTTAHFTNIKPDFMLQLFTETAVSGLWYLDPDICIVEQWEYFDDWLTCGVALCEDVNSPLERDHPRRIGWRRYFGAHGIELQFRTGAYVNGGCVGLRRDNLHFLGAWQELSACMAQTIGGLDASVLEGGAALRQNGFARCFEKSDQDALNAAVEMCQNVTVSILPQSGMGFVAGNPVMTHALGARKPWRRRYFLEGTGLALPPTSADKVFWKNVSGPLRSFGPARAPFTRLTIALASFIGRFYRRR